MRVVVSGGKGFIGRAVKAHLEAQGSEAVSYDLPEYDIRDYQDLIDVSEGADAFIHMAGVLGTHELFDTIDTAIEVNIRGTTNVLQACLANDVAFVGITMPRVFKSIYTGTKVATGWFASAFNETYGLPVSHVRAFNAFGPGQAHGPGHPQKIVPTFAVEAWAGRPIPIWGSGNQGVDLIHTDDLGRMLVDAARFGNDQTFDGGTGQMFTVNEVAEMVLDITGSKAGIQYNPMRRGEKETQIVAEGEGWDELGWKPEFRYEQLVDAVLWYRDQYRPH